MARWIVALLIAIVSLVAYFGTTSENPITGEKQRVALKPDEEIALGLKSAPEMAAQMGGLSRNPQARALVERVGATLARESIAAKSPYRFGFHVLADPRTINAFALPGGPVLIARHASEHLAKAKLTQGLIGAATVGTGDYTTAQIGQVVASLIDMRYGRDDELESDALGIRIMAQAGYDPRAMIGVMATLAKASSGSRQPEFFSTHPRPENRQARIREEIAKRFPSGVPEGLKK